MLKPGKFLHIKLSKIETEGTFDTLASVHCSGHSQSRGVSGDFRGGKSLNSPTANDTTIAS